MSAVLSFPQTAKAKRLYHSRMDGAGFLRLLLMEREGEALPENVQRIDEPDGVTHPEKSATLLLALLVMQQLPKAKQEALKATLRCMAYGRRPDPCAVQLLNVLNGRQ